MSNICFKTLKVVSILILSSFSHIASLNAAAARPLISAAARSGIPIARLDVEIKTRDENNATIGKFQMVPGSNHVWLDLGFKAWDLSSLKTASGRSPFHIKGGVDRWENIPIPANVQLTTDDLFQIRLEKKGWAGFTHAFDGFAGGWKPENITLYVNGEKFGETLAVLPPGEKLNKDRPAWRHLFKDISAEERFLNGLRIEPIAEVGSWFGHVIAGVTTPFKLLNISGWQHGPLKRYKEHDRFTSSGPVKEDLPIEHVSVEGVLYTKPRPATDGYLTLDLKLSVVRIRGANGAISEYAVNSERGIRHDRYIRVEYQRIKIGRGWDSRLRTEKWSIGDRFYAEGKIFWDTDAGGFYEIHPDLGDAFLKRIN